MSAALQFLEQTFGFVERMRISGPGGSIMHAEVELEDGVVMLGCPGPQYQNPNRCGHVTQSLYVFVDDVDEHHQHAREAGANMLEKPQDQPYGDRRYGAEDAEGHQWYFAQHVRDVAPEEHGTDGLTSRGPLPAQDIAASTPFSVALGRIAREASSGSGA